MDQKILNLILIVAVAALVVAAVSVVLLSGGDNDEGEKEKTPDSSPITSYTISYSANGGSGSIASQSVNKGGSAILKANSFVYADHYFKSWNTKADGTGAIYYSGASFTPTSDITLYASWNESDPQTYAVNYHSNYGTDSIITQSTLAGNITAKSALTRADYTFTSWNTKADGTGTSYFPGSSITVSSDISLYAQWNAVPVTTAKDLSYNFKISESTKTLKYGGGLLTLTAPDGKSFALVQITIRNNTVELGYSLKEIAITGFRLITDDGEGYDFSLKNTTAYSLTLENLLANTLAKGASTTFYLVYEIPDNETAVSLDLSKSGLSIELDKGILIK
ncbi:MAG: InlB B-repeat-containing protein [Candidatus Methanoplasma sp.]|jgi:uncharacterized repeat protein (TIGR02543 family)|nr:InlB B-repeat-containing protein [Candidatus Methanoplasma sp.]